MTVVSPLETGTTTGPPTQWRRSPLGHRAEQLAAASAGSVRLVEEPFLTQVDLRVGPNSTDAERIERALDVALPRSTPNRVLGDETISALWLGPDEWLIVAPDGAAERIVSTAGTALGEGFGSVVDVSANRTTVRLSGTHARETLEKVCSLDLHPRSFGPGHCAQTLVGRTQAILWQVAAEPAYRIMVRCSFAEYLADLLLDAMAEFNTA